MDSWPNFLLSFFCCCWSGSHTLVWNWYSNGKVGCYSLIYSSNQEDTFLIVSQLLQNRASVCIYKVVIYHPTNLVDGWIHGPISSKLLCPWRRWPNNGLQQQITKYKSLLIRETIKGRWMNDEGALYGHGYHTIVKYGWSSQLCPAGWPAHLPGAISRQPEQSVSEPSSHQ